MYINGTEWGIQKLTNTNKFNGFLTKVQNQFNGNTAFSTNGVRPTGHS